MKTKKAPSARMKPIKSESMEKSEREVDAIV